MKTMTQVQQMGDGQNAEGTQTSIKIVTEMETIGERSKGVIKEKQSSLSRIGEGRRALERAGGKSRKE